MKASPESARPGQLITLSAGIPVKGAQVTFGSWGRLGAVSNGSFVPMYYLSVDIVGKHPSYVPVNPPPGLAGVAFSNQPFQVKVPPVHAGDYEIQFDFSVTPQQGESRLRNYTLCTRLHVTS